MGENIYDLLNNVEMDMTDYNEEKLSPWEKSKAKHRIIKEVRAMENRKKVAKRKKIMAAVAALAFVSVGTVGLGNQVFAKGLFSDVIDNLFNISKGTKYESEDTKRYTLLGENSVDVSEEIKKAGNKDYNISADSNGVNISVSDIYCDGYMLNYTASLKTDDKGLKAADWISPSYKEGSNYFVINGVNIGPAGSSMSFTKADDGTFVMSGSIYFANISDEIDLKDADTLDVEYVFTDLIGSDSDEWDEQGEYVTTGKAEGEWKLHFPVTVNRDNNEQFVINKTENGVCLKNAVKTQAGLVVEIETPDFSGEPFGDKYNDPDISISDSDGKDLIWLGGNSTENEDGTAVWQIMVLYEGQKDLELNVINKNVGEGTQVIANIPFNL